jgi:hypothetical protein
VGVIWGTIVRGERGGEVGGVVVIFEEVDIDIEGRDAESGLQESLRRQLERERRISIYVTYYMFVSHAGPKIGCR